MIKFVRRGRHVTGAGSQKYSMVARRQLTGDDLTTVLAIARAGTLSGAQQELGVTHATVFRRLRAIERRLETKLFDKQDGRYNLTSAGEDVASVACEIEQRVDGLERRILGRDRQISGNVRITTTDTLLFGLISPILSAVRTSYPDITLEIRVSNHLLDLSRQEADLAIVPVTHPPEALIGYKVGTIAQAAYASDAFVRYESQRCASSYPRSWVATDERTGYTALDDWMQMRQPDQVCVFRVDTLIGMWAAVRDGIGAGVLPCYLGDADPSLQRIGHIIPEMACDLWLLAHRDVRRAARLRAIVSCLRPLLTEKLSAIH